MRRYLVAAAAVEFVPPALAGNELRIEVGTLKAEMDSHWKPSAEAFGYDPV